MSVVFYENNTERNVTKLTFKEEIILTIENIVNKHVKNIIISNDIPTVVTEISGDKYKVSIDGVEHWVKDGVNISPTVGMSVWVHVPNGKLGNAYVCAKR